MAEDSLGAGHTAQSHLVNTMQAKTHFYQNKISENERNQKQLLKIVNSILGSSITDQLPLHDSPDGLANRCVNYFEDKVPKFGLI